MWSAPVVLGSVILTLFFLERCVVFALLSRLFPQLKKTTSILRASSTVMSTLHSSTSFCSALFMLYTCELYPHGGEVFVDYYLLPQYRLHMLCEFGWYLFDTMSELTQMAFDDEEAGIEKSAAIAKTSSPPPRVSDTSSDDSSRTSSKSTKKVSEKKKGGFSLLQAGFLVHHMPPLFGLYVYYFHADALPEPTQRVCAFIIVRMTMWHATTPLQNLRWFMDKLQLGEDFIRSNRRHKSSSSQTTTWPTVQKLAIAAIYQLNFLVFLVAFFGIRIYGLIPLIRSVGTLYGLPPETTTLYAVVKTLMPIKCMFLTGTLYALSVYWFHLNAKRALRVFIGGGRRSSKKDAGIATVSGETTL